MDSIHTRTPACVTLVFAILLAGVLLSPLASGDFGIIDDHELVEFAYRYAHGEADFIAGMAEGIKQSEIARWDTAARYRPVYYVLRVLKAHLFGGAPGPYFAVNMLGFALALGVLGLTVGRFFPWFITLSFLVAITSLPFHVDLWPRLGPAENDAFLFTAFFTYSCFHLDKKYFWPLACIFAALAIGCKENFLLLLVPLLAAGLYGVRHRLLCLWSMTWIAIPALVAVPVVGVVMRVASSGRDIYAHDASVSKIASVFSLFFSSRHFLVPVVCIVILTVCWYLCSAREDLVQNLKIRANICIEKEAVLTASLVFVSLFFVFFGNVLFYREIPHSGARYGFPFHALPYALMLCPLYIVRNAFDRICGNKIIFLGIGIVVIVLLSFHDRIAKNRDKIARHIEVTNDFTSVLGELPHYEKVVLINTGEVMRSYEPYASMKRFVRFYRLPPVLYFPFFAESSNVLNRGLAESLRNRIASEPNDYSLNSRTLLLEADVWALRKIEHGSDVRSMADLLFSQPKLRWKSAESVIRVDRELVFHIPTDDPDVTGFVIEMADENDMSQWSVSINDIPVDEPSLSREGTRLHMSLSKEVAAVAPFPQLPSITFTPAKTGIPPLRLRTLQILRN